MTRPANGHDCAPVAVLEIEEGEGCDVGGPAAGGENPDCVVGSQFILKRHKGPVATGIALQSVDNERLADILRGEGHFERLDAFQNGSVLSAGVFKMEDPVHSRVALEHFDLGGDHQAGLRIGPAYPMLDGILILFGLDLALPARQQLGRGHAAVDKKEWSCAGGQQATRGWGGSARERTLRPIEYSQDLGRAGHHSILRCACGNYSVGHRDISAEVPAVCGGVASARGMPTVKAIMPTTMAAIPAHWIGATLDLNANTMAI